MAARCTQILIPRFNSEVEVLTAAELECVHNAIANHRAYLDPGFVRKVTARWQKVYNTAGRPADSAHRDPAERLFVMDDSAPRATALVPQENVRPLSSIPIDRASMANGNGVASQASISNDNKFVTLAGRRASLNLSRPSTVM
eukprot:SAG31_NODE_15601_length_747_cov_1.185185_1_plen_143_part_00